MDKIIDELVSWLKDNVKEANSKGVIFGLSGGIDSAVIAGISKLAFPDTSLGLIMPIHSIIEDEKDALLVSESLKLNVKKVDLSNTYDNLIKSSINSENTLAKSNIKPRLRMTTLYYYGQDLAYLVLGSSNKSEFHIGYFTKHGDSGADLLPLADFTKGEVYELARILNIPEKIIEKKPSAGLWLGQTDEEELGFSYDILDDYLNGKPIDQKTKTIIEHKNKVTEHKRKTPLVFKK